MPDLYKDGKKIGTHVVDTEIHHRKTHWIDMNGNVHKADDTGGLFSGPRTVGTWDGETLKDKEGDETGHKS